MIEHKKILFVRICGTGMSSLALICKKAGAQVYGVDEAYYPPVSITLESADIPLYSMTDLQKIITDDPPDIIIVGNALRGTSDEATLILHCSIPYYSMPSFIESFLLPGHTNIVVAGTHGKTTTSTIIAEYLKKRNQPLSYMIGGIPNFSKSNADFCSEGYFVLEGDEYDTAFFDKEPKFLHYSPDYTIITSIEFDHADIYDSVDTIFSKFEKLVDITKRKVIISIDFEKNRSLIQKKGKERFITYSISDESADILIKSDGRDGVYSLFSWNSDSGKSKQYKTPLFGDQNLMNIASLIALLHHIAPHDELDAAIVRGMQGIKRRQEFLGTIDGAAVYSDFAHHPTAASYTLDSFKKFFSDKKIKVVFDPATNSNSRDIFEKQYTDVFAKADKLLITKPAKLDRVPPIQQFDPQRLCDELNKQNKDKAVFIKKAEDIKNWIVSEADKDSIIVIMSNGSFNGVFDLLSTHYD